MKSKLGTLFIALGVLALLGAAGLFGYNQWDNARAEKAADAVLNQLEETLEQPKILLPGESEAAPATAEELAKTVRAHWAIENRLHWMLDVCFGEDDCMIRKDNAQQNLSLLKKIVLNLIRADKTDTAKTSLRLKRKRAAWDDDIRMKMLGIHPL